MGNLKIIAIEGIDRLGKSTFIQCLLDRLICLDKTNYFSYSVEKPSIGLNTINAKEYPLRDIKGIFEIRNIGLFEEFIFNAQHYMKKSNINQCIIRDRFHLSELAYGKIMRYDNFSLFGDGNPDVGFKRYLKWNNWFEEQLLNIGIEIYLITFVLTSRYQPNKDEVEALTPVKLTEINQEYIIQHEKSILPKKIIYLNKDVVNGYTDILSYVEEIVEFVTNKE